MLIADSRGSYGIRRWGGTGPEMEGKGEEEIAVSNGRLKVWGISD